MESAQRIYKADHNCTAAKRSLTPSTLLLSVRGADDIKFYTPTDDTPRSVLLHSTFKENSPLNTNTSLADNSYTRCNCFQSYGSRNDSLESTLIIPLHKISKTYYDFLHYIQISTDSNCHTLTERGPQQLLINCTCHCTIKSMIGLWEKR
jgi:hypothetical protein